MHILASLPSRAGMMQLKTSYREEAVGTLRGTKHHYVVCHVTFSSEERAIIQERGLYDHFIQLPADSPLPTRLQGFGSMAMKIAGIIIFPFALVSSCVTVISPQTGGVSGVLSVPLLVGAIGLFTLGRYRDHKAEQRVESDLQPVTLRRLLTNPEFVVHAYSLEDARAYEATVRDELANLAQRIRENAAVPERNVYDL